MKAPVLIITALILGSMIAAPAIQMSFAKKSSGDTNTSDSPKKKEKVTSDGKDHGCAGCLPHTTTTTTTPGPIAPTPSGVPNCSGCCDGAADCAHPPSPTTPPTPTPKNPHENEEGVGCDPTGKICDDGQDHSHDGFRGGCFHFGTQVTCGVCRGPNDLVSTNCGHPRTIIKTQVIRVPVATPGLTIAQAASLSARIAQLQSLMSKPYGAECKNQIQTLLDVTQQALDAQNGFIADHLPTLQQGIPACYGSNAEQITETS
jgi:hypothetical protein